MNQVTVYSKGYCPYCKSARRMLAARGIGFTLIDVTSDAVALDEMVQRSGRNTVPQIFFGDTHIGGYDDLVQYYRLREALAA